MPEETTHTAIPTPGTDDQHVNDHFVVSGLLTGKGGKKSDQQLRVEEIPFEIGKIAAVRAAAMH